MLRVISLLLRAYLPRQVCPWEPFQDFPETCLLSNKSFLRPPLKRLGLTWIHCADAIPDGWNQKTTMATTWQNKVVLITGASSGIGRSLAVALAQRGAAIGLMARRAD